MNIFENRLSLNIDGDYNFIKISDKESIYGE